MKPDVETMENRATDDAILDLEDDPHRAALELNPEKPERLTWSTILAVGALGLSFVAPISCGFLLVTAILVQIGTALDDITTIAWIPGGWSIASSVSFSIAGSLSDIFGRRWVSLIGQFLVLVGCIVGATANTTRTVICASTIIGFGCGIVFVAYAGIPELLPNKYRAVGLAYTELCITTPWGIGAVIFANLLAAHASWRWCYYIGIIYSVVAWIGTFLFYYPPARPQRDYDKTRWQELKEIDYIGVALYATGLTVFLVGLTWAGQPGHPWSSASVIAPLVLGIVTFLGCFAYDWTIAKQPFFPLSLFKRVRQYTILLLLVFVSGMTFYSMSALLPQGTFYMFTHNPTEVGLIELPNGFAQFFGGTIMCAIAPRIKHLKIQIIAALVVQTLFVALYATAIPHNKPAWMALQFFGQCSFAFITVLCYVIAGLHVPLRELGIASGLIGTFRSAGGSVGNAVFSTIINSVVADRLPAQIAQAAISSGFPASGLDELIPAAILVGSGVPGAFQGIEGLSPTVEAAVLEAYKQAYAHSYRMTFYATIPFGVLGIVAAFFISDPSQYLTNHTAVHMERHTMTGHNKRQDGAEISHVERCADTNNGNDSAVVGDTEAGNTKAGQVMSHVNATNY